MLGSHLNCSTASSSGWAPAAGSLLTPVLLQIALKLCFSESRAVTEQKFANQRSRSCFTLWRSEEKRLVELSQLPFLSPSHRALSGSLEASLEQPQQKPTLQTTSPPPKTPPVARVHKAQLHQQPHTAASSKSSFPTYLAVA